MSSAYVTGFARYIPHKRVTNHELSSRLDTSDEWIYGHTGIRARYVVDAEESTSDLAIRAAKEALKISNTSAGSIDFLLLSTSTPDYPGNLPATACIVQDAIGASNAAALDIGNACSGFVYGLEVARSLVVSGSVDRVLFICSEVYSRIVNWKDRNTCILFGDGAGAVLISSEPSEKGLYGEISTAILGTDGSKSQALVRKAGESKFPMQAEEFPLDCSYIAMNGRKVFNFAVEIIPKLIREVLEREKLRIGDIDVIVPHQANLRLIEATCRMHSIPRELFYSNISEYANTSSASIPIALVDVATEGVIKKGSIVLVLGFGAGFSYGASVIRF